MYKWLKSAEHREILFGAIHSNVKFESFGIVKLQMAGWTNEQNNSVSVLKLCQVCTSQSWNLKTLMNFSLPEKKTCMELSSPCLLP